MRSSMPARRKKRPEEMPKNAMGIMDLSTGQVARVDKVQTLSATDGKHSGFSPIRSRPSPNRVAQVPHRQVRGREAALPLARGAVERNTERPHLA
jgi:hypothetical protein